MSATAAESEQENYANAGSALCTGWAVIISGLQRFHVVIRSVLYTLMIDSPLLFQWSVADPMASVAITAARATIATG